MSAQYTDYRDVPWYRQQYSVNVLIVAGFFVFPPLLWAACLFCLTGDIYTEEEDEDGFVTKCPPSTKISALLALVVHSFGVIYVLCTEL